MYLWEWVVEMECMEPAQDNVQWRTLVLVVSNISVLLYRANQLLLQPTIIIIIIIIIVVVVVVLQWESVEV